MDFRLTTILPFKNVLFPKKYKEMEKQRASILPVSSALINHSTCQSGRQRAQSSVFILNFHGYKKEQRNKIFFLWVKLSTL